MPSFVPSAPGRRSVLAALSALLLFGAPAFAAPDDAVLLGRQEALLADQARALEVRLDVERGELVAARARLDSARNTYEEALAEVEARVVETYKRSADEPDPVAEAIVGDEVDELAARVDSAATVSRRDADALARLRGALKEMDELERDVARRKSALADAAADLEVRRLALKQRIETAQAIAGTDGQVAPVAPPPATLSVGIQTATALGLPFRPATSLRDNEPGLPADVVAAQSLPGFFAFDPTTGKADFGPDTPRAGGAPSAASFDAVASWYGPGFEGRRMANGGTFDPRGLTAAHRTLPLGTWLRVSHAGRYVVVQVTDRGPYVQGRDLDLSQGAAEMLGLAGVAGVHVEVVTGSTT